MMPWGGGGILNFILSFKCLWVNYLLFKKKLKKNPCVLNKNATRSSVKINNKKETMFLKLELLGLRPCKLLKHTNKSALAALPCKTVILHNHLNLHFRFMRM
jgi:hypothetical protein